MGNIAYLNYCKDCGKPISAFPSRCYACRKKKEAKEQKGVEEYT